MRLSSSTRSAARSARTSVALPITLMSAPGCWRRAETSFTRSLPRMMVVGVQLSSASESVSDTTYFWMLFIQSAKGSPARSGQAPAITFQVRRPWRSASVRPDISPIAAPMTSGSKNRIDQPPWRNPPSVSSSGPPGACTTPSRLMNSLITIRMPC